MSAKRLLSADGKRLLNADGKLKLSNAAGENCCCNPPDPCGACVSGTTPRVVVVTFSGITPCGCRPSPNNAQSSFRTHIIDGTWTLTQAFVTPTQCEWNTVVPNALISRLYGGPSCGTFISSASYAVTLRFTISTTPTPAVNVSASGIFSGGGIAISLPLTCKPQTYFFGTNTYAPTVGSCSYLNNYGYGGNATVTIS